MKYLLFAPGLAERAQSAAPGVSRRQRLNGVRSGCSFSTCRVSVMARLQVRLGASEAGTRPARASIGADSASALAGRDQGEPLFQRRRAKPIVEGQNLQGRRPPLGGEESGSQLERVSRPQRMDPKKPYGALAQHLARLDLVPTIRQLGEPLRRLRQARGVQRAYPV